MRRKRREAVSGGTGDGYYPRRIASFKSPANQAGGALTKSVVR